MDTEKEVARLDKRIDGIEDVQDCQGKLLDKVVKDLLKFLHVAIGIASGLVLNKLGLEKVIDKLF